MVDIVFHEQTKTFHLYNEHVSYLFCVLENGQLGQLYCGRRLHDKPDFSYLCERSARAMGAYPAGQDPTFSLEQIRQEYPSGGGTDFRHPAFSIRQENGSRIMDFRYEGFVISEGKPALEGLPATYVEDPKEAKTLTVVLRDAVTGLCLELFYTIFSGYAAIARSARFTNEGEAPVQIESAMSLSLDLPDCDYEWLQLSGAWARERHLYTRPLTPGITAIDSLRGNSSHNENPFMALKRPSTTEDAGEVLGFSFLYSGNFRIQAEVDTFSVTRVTVGIAPEGFSWRLAPHDHFQTPEAVLVYASDGLNGMSQTFHRLFARRLVRGEWRDRPRPILLNNWEATYFDFTEDKLLAIAKRAKDCGIELFVLDDGWFGARRSDHAGLGDWVPNRKILPDGIAGLSEKIDQLGLLFGLWFEPEMVNPDSDFYRAHPDWILQTPQRAPSLGRHQYVLDFSRPEVVDAVFVQMEQLLATSKISYIKWDMNRSITECYSAAYPPAQQGEIYHRYILGVYALYERLHAAFPHVLFESCASGGGRFDAGMLYYAPQAWASDDSDAVERLKIQYGTSLCYPISSIGSHVSAVPNHQVNRVTPLHTRANVAHFGTFGYELDLGKLTPEEIEAVKGQVAFQKQYRALLQFGTFYRLKSPFAGNETAWMVVSADRSTAIVGDYRVLNGANQPFSRLRLRGLDPDACYTVSGGAQLHYGDELMEAGLVTSSALCGEMHGEAGMPRDFDSRLYVLQKKE